MRAVDLTFKKAEVVDYYSQLDQVKVRLLFNDGKDKGIFKQLTITDPTKHANEWIAEVRTKLKEQHKIHTLDDSPLAGMLTFRLSQDVDVIHEKLARFLAQTKERIHSGKLAKLSYYDMEKKIKGFSVLLH